MLIDTHSHPDRYGDPDSALGQIKGLGILTLANSMDPASYLRNLDISRECELVVPCFGIHPWNAPEHADRLAYLSRFVEQSPVLGELGLDFFFVKDASARPAQVKVLEFFLDAASQHDRLVILHTKGAEAEVLRLLDAHGVRRAIIHWYSGPLDIMEDFLARGACFTIGVEALRPGPVQKIARRIPDELLLTETDNPGGYEWLTGEPGTPGLIQDVVGALARIRETTEERIIQTVHRNLGRLIRDDPMLSWVHERFFQTHEP